MHILNEALKGDPLIKIIQKENFMGWIYQIDYDYAYVMTNDLWKVNVLGVPFNCFLVASTYDPDNFSVISNEEKEVLLLRVVGATRLPQDDDLVRTKIDYYQQQTEAIRNNPEQDYDEITRHQLQFGGLKCSILGTFFMRDEQLWLGSDIESFSASLRFNVFRPRKEALSIIVNHIDPIQLNKSKEEAEALGLSKDLKRFEIGTVRYTSTDRHHRNENDEKVKFGIQPTDFLARRTAVLGMTRTGKSNMIKKTVAVVSNIAKKSEVKIGQIIYDINGEYANANKQDQGAISEVYPSETIRYRLLKTEGFEELQNNFYIQINEGFLTIKEVLMDEKSTSSANDVKVFLNSSFDEPDQQDRSAHTRWLVKVAAYKTMLYKAGYEAPPNTVVRFKANENVRKAVTEVAKKELNNPKDGLNLSEAAEWFKFLRIANKPNNGGPLKSSGGGDFLDEEVKAILNMIENKNENDAYINGYKILNAAKRYHSPRRTEEVGEEVFEHLRNGKIIILDLSVGDPVLKEKIGMQIAREIFNKSMSLFVQGENPPNIVIYVEEAHNLIGKTLELTETWPRIAKEGAKYRIALVYATQEISSIHPSILSNTENWFVSHINNENEIKTLAKFYDFIDFSRSLMRAQDVGFARVKTLSSPFVVPVQIDKFDPINV